jgi:hypothetical protein
MDFDEYILNFFEKLVRKLNKKCSNPKWKINRIYWNEEGFRIDSSCGIFNGHTFKGEMVCENCADVLFEYEYEYQRILHLKKLTDKVSKLEGGIDILGDY